jgi:hypothetical protein
VRLIDHTVVSFEQDHYVRETEMAMPDIDTSVHRTDSFVFAPQVSELTSDLFHFIWLNSMTAAKPYSEVYAAMMASLDFD